VPATVPPNRPTPILLERIAPELARAAALHRGGRLDEAETIYRAILVVQPQNFDCLHLLGVVALQHGDANAAVQLIGQALAVAPRNPDALNNRGNALRATGRPADALADYERALAIAPELADAHHNRGLALGDLRRFAEALAAFERAVALRPDDADAQLSRGRALLALDRQREALAAFERAVVLAPHDPAAHHARGAALQELGQELEALASYERGLTADPRSPDLLLNHGNLLRKLGRRAEALASYERAIGVRPDRPEPHSNRSIVLRELGLAREALISAERALALEPRLAEAHGTRGDALRDLNRLRDALASYDRALALRPERAELHSSRSVVLRDLGRHADALASCDRALALSPELPEALHNRGTTLLFLKRYADAAAAFERLLAAAPGFKYALGHLLHARAHACDWRNQQTLLEQLGAEVRRGLPSVTAWIFATMAADPADQLRCARAYAADLHPAPFAPLWRGERYAHDRVRIAYLSSDLREHATAYLTAGLFERHDRERFELIAISYAPHQPGPMHDRLGKAFDRFVDASGASDDEVARMLHGWEVDVLVDLNVFTHGARPGVPARRPAPVQVNYLGLPGTSGAPYYDYLIADATLVPPDDEPHYSEQVVRLPDCYQVNDAARARPDAVPARDTLGLPRAGFVFCCFNNSYKVGPEVFDVWMRLLRAVDGSVLWLYEGNPDAATNLRHEAEQAGVDPRRLVFAPKLPLVEHLARHPAADLFLDTLPCNAHTTASDALWMGLPLLTCRGTSFAGRVAASLLQAAGLPELVADDLAGYEALALRAATDPAWLGALRARLDAQRTSGALFDTDRSRRLLEAAYLTMHQRHRDGLPPAGFDVARLPRADAGG